MHPRRLFLVAAATLVALTLGRAPASAAADQGAGAFVKSLGNQVIDTLKNKSISAEQRDQTFRDLFVNAFDVPGISRFTLGRYWRQATPEQRTEYAKLFENFIIATYSNRFSQYSGEGFDVKEAHPDDRGDTLVQSVITRPNGPPVRVDWRVHGTDGQYKITDVVVEGISMAITERQEFSSVIDNNGGKVEALLAALRQKVQQAAKGAK